MHPGKIKTNIVPIIATGAGTVALLATGTLLPIHAVKFHTFEYFGKRLSLDADTPLGKLFNSNKTRTYVD